MYGLERFENRFLYRVSTILISLQVRTRQAIQVSFIGSNQSTKGITVSTFSKPDILLNILLDNHIVRPPFVLFICVT
ncbi:hypothetical protein D1872_186450 [compost metagenome]